MQMKENLWLQELHGCVGWWTGYKLGGVIALFTAEFLENVGIVDYWQKTF